MNNDKVIQMPKKEPQRKLLFRGQRAPGVIYAPTGKPQRVWIEIPDEEEGLTVGAQTTLAVLTQDHFFKYLIQIVDMGAKAGEPFFEFEILEGPVEENITFLVRSKAKVFKALCDAENVKPAYVSPDGVHFYKSE
jgi:hypothetical protein